MSEGEGRVNYRHLQVAKRSKLLPLCSVYFVRGRGCVDCLGGGGNPSNKKRTPTTSSSFSSPTCTHPPLSHRTGSFFPFSGDWAHVDLFFVLFGTVLSRVVYFHPVQSYVWLHSEVNTHEIRVIHRHLKTDILPTLATTRDHLIEKPFQDVDLFGSRICLCIPLSEVSR